MKTIAQLREKIKPLGYKVLLKNMSWGKHAVYVHVETGQELSSNVFTRETKKVWEPLLSFIQEHRKEVSVLGQEQKIYGLEKG